MKIYLDTVIVDEIQKASSTGIIEGITTTPTFFARDRYKDPISCYKKIREIFKKDLHIELLGSTIEEINKNLNELLEANLGNITFKIPINWHCIKILKEHSKNHIFNVHLIYNLNQAVIAAESGAQVICLLMGRYDDSGGDSYKLLSEIKNVFLKYNYSTYIMASSIRHKEHVEQAFKAQSDIITIPPSIFWKLLDSPLTNDGIEKFKLDLKKVSLN